MEEVGPFWQDFYVVLGMVFNLWEVKQRDMRPPILFRLVHRYKPHTQHTHTLYNQYLFLLPPEYVLGTSTCEYLLGRTSVWGISKILQENLHITNKHVVNVHRGCWGSHGIIWPPKIIVHLFTRSKSYVTN